MMHEKLLDYKTAKLAKEKGFNAPSHYYYSKSKTFIHHGPYNQLHLTDIAATTQSLLQKWLREVYKISVCVDFRHSKTSKIEGINSVYYDVNIYTLSGGDAWKTIKLSQIRDNYEEALDLGLLEALKLIK